MTTAHRLCLAAFFTVFAWSGYKPNDRFTWFLEVLPALIGLAICAFLWNRFRFTTLVYAIITVHCMVLMVGGRYSYAEVPLFNWIRDEFGHARNHYDRVGHFMQGFGPALIAREGLLRLDVIRDHRWLNPIIVSIILALSAVYEFFEWWIALLTGESATQFLGTQGDQWDTQWDMFICTIGACLALALLSRAHDRALRTHSISNVT